MLAGVCKNPQVDIDGPAVVELLADVAAAVSRRAAAVSEDVYEVILREIPELRDDKPVLTLLASSVHSNIGTCLQVMQHQIDLSAVQAPAAALEYARRLAQRGTSLTALLRSYRLGHACFSDWFLRELPQQADDATMITAASLSMTKIVAGYVDQTSEEIVTAYTQERESWLRNRSTARAARIRDLLSGERVNVSATEATLGYRLRQYHMGVVCWTDDAAAAADTITRLEHAISQVAPVAMMLGSADLLRAWVLATLAGLAADDEHQARLRETLLVFLQTGGSYKATAMRLMLHKNTVQYRIRKAEESLGRPVGGNRHDVELALQASRWLGASVLQPVAG